MGVHAEDDSVLAHSQCQDQNNPKAAGSARDGMDGFECLAGANDVKVFYHGVEPFAIITATKDDGFQVVNISSPNKPIAVTSGAQGFGNLKGVGGVATFLWRGNQYAIVTAATGFSIIDLSDPFHPELAGTGADGFDGFSQLRGATAVETFVVGSTRFAIIVSSLSNGVSAALPPPPPPPISLSLPTRCLFVSQFQIVDLKDPHNPVAAGSATDGANSFDMLAGANAVCTFISGGAPYAIVTAPNDDGFQVVDLWDPYHPAASGSRTNGQKGFNDLKRAFALDTFMLPGDTVYAIIATFSENSFQIVNLRDPSDPKPTDYWDEGTIGVQMQGEIAKMTFLITTSDVDSHYCCNLHIPLCALPESMYCLLSGRDRPLLTAAFALPTAS